MGTSLRDEEEFRRYLDSTRQSVQQTAQQNTQAVNDEEEFNQFLAGQAPEQRGGALKGMLNTVTQTAENVAGIVETAVTDPGTIIDWTKEGLSSGAALVGESVQDPFGTAKMLLWDGLIKPLVVNPVRLTFGNQPDEERYRMGEETAQAAMGWGLGFGAGKLTMALGRGNAYSQAARRLSGVKRAEDLTEIVARLAPNADDALKLGEAANELGKLRLARSMAAWTVGGFTEEAVSGLAGARDPHEAFVNAFNEGMLGAVLGAGAGAVSAGLGTGQRKRLRELGRISYDQAANHLVAVMEPKDIPLLAADLMEGLDFVNAVAKNVHGDKSIEITGVTNLNLESLPANAEYRLNENGTYDVLIMGAGSKRTEVAYPIAINPVDVQHLEPNPVMVGTQQDAYAKPELPVINTIPFAEFNQQEEALPGQHQKGASAGGLYSHMDGIKYYIKTPNYKETVVTEVLANALYRMFGIAAPESHMTQIGGKLGVANKFINNSTPAKHAILTQSLAREFLDGFVVDVIFGARDVIGTNPNTGGWDNIIVKADGSVVRIDNAGVLGWGGLQGKRSKEHTDNIYEWDSFLDPKKAPTYAKMFEIAGIKTQGELNLEEQLNRIEAVLNKHNGWSNLIEQLIPNVDAKLKKQLIDTAVTRYAKVRVKVIDILNGKHQQKPSVKPPMKGLVSSKVVSAEQVFNHLVQGNEQGANVLEGDFELWKYLHNLELDTDLTGGSESLNAYIYEIQESLAQVRNLGTFGGQLVDVHTEKALESLLDYMSHIGKGDLSQQINAKKAELAALAALGESTTEVQFELGTLIKKQRELLENTNAQLDTPQSKWPEVTHTLYPLTQVKEISSRLTDVLQELKDTGAPQHMIHAAEVGLEALRVYHDGLLEFDNIDVTGFTDVANDHLELVLLEYNAVANGSSHGLADELMGELVQIADLKKSHVVALKAFESYAHFRNEVGKYEQQVEMYQSQVDAFAGSDFGVPDASIEVLHNAQYALEQAEQQMSTAYDFAVNSLLIWNTEQSIKQIESDLKYEDDVNVKDQGIQLKDYLLGVLSKLKADSVAADADVDVYLPDPYDVVSIPKLTAETQDLSVKLAKEGGKGWEAMINNHTKDLLTVLKSSDHAVLYSDLIELINDWNFEIKALEKDMAGVQDKTDHQEYIKQFNWLRGYAIDWKSTIGGIRSHYNYDEINSNTEEDIKQKVNDVIDTTISWLKSAQLAMAGHDIEQGAKDMKKLVAIKAKHLKDATVYTLPSGAQIPKKYEGALILDFNDKNLSKSKAAIISALSTGPYALNANQVATVHKFKGSSFMQLYMDLHLTNDQAVEIDEWIKTDSVYDGVVHYSNGNEANLTMYKDDAGNSINDSVTIKMGNAPPQKKLKINVGKKAQDTQPVLGSVHGNPAELNLQSKGIPVVLKRSIYKAIGELALAPKEHAKFVREFLYAPTLYDKLNVAYTYLPHDDFMVAIDRTRHKLPLNTVFHKVDKSGYITDEMIEFWKEHGIFPHEVVQLEGQSYDVVGSKDGMITLRHIISNMIIEVPRKDIVRQENLEMTVTEMLQPVEGHSPKTIRDAYPKFVMWLQAQKNNIANGQPIDYDSAPPVPFVRNQSSVDKLEFSPKRKGIWALFAQATGENTQYRGGDTRKGKVSLQNEGGPHGFWGLLKLQKPLLLYGKDAEGGATGSAIVRKLRPDLAGNSMKAQNELLKIVGQTEFNEHGYHNGGYPMWDRLGRELATQIGYREVLNVTSSSDPGSTSSELVILYPESEMTKFRYTDVEARNIEVKDSKNYYKEWISQLKDSLTTEERALFEAREAKLKAEYKSGVKKVASTLVTHGLKVERHDGKLAIIKGRQVVALVDTFKQVAEELAKWGSNSGDILIPPPPTDIPFKLLSDNDGWDAKKNIKKNMMQGLRKYLNLTLAKLVPTKDLFISLEDTYGKRFFHDFWLPLQQAKARYTIAIQPWVERVKALAPIAALDGERKTHIFNAIQTFSAEELLSDNPTILSRPLTSEEKSIGHDLGARSTYDERRQAYEYFKALRALEEETAGLGTDDQITKHDEFFLAWQGKLSPGAVLAVGVMKNLRTVGPDRASIYAVFRLADAIEFKSLNRADYMKLHGFSALERHGVEEIEKLFKLLGPEMGIEDYRMLGGYVTMMKKYDGAVTDGSYIMNAKNVTAAQREFIYALHRTGETVDVITDPVEILQRYLTYGMKVKHLFPAVSEATRFLKNAYTGMDTTAAHGVHELASRYLNEIRGFRQPSDVLALEGEYEIKQDSFVRMMGKMGVDKEVTGRFLSTYLRVSELATQGFKPIAGIRDATSTMMFYTARFGIKRTARMMRMWSEAMKEKEGLREEGTIPGLSVNLLNLIDGKLTQDGLMAKFAELGFKYSGQPAVFLQSHAMVYLEQIANANEAVTDYVSGKIDRSKLEDRLHLDTFDGVVQVEFWRLLDEQPTKATAYLADMAGREMVGHYGMANHPLFMQTKLGKVLGQHGQWPLWMVQNFGRMLTQGNAKRILGTAARLTLMMAAVDEAGEEAGFNLKSWLLSPHNAIFTGGPLAQSGLWAALAVGSNYEPTQEFAQSMLERQVQLGRPQYFLPIPAQAYYILEAYQRSQNYDPPHIVGARLLGIPVDYDQYPRP